MHPIEEYQTCHALEMDPEELMAKVVYLYLFKGRSVKTIETELFGEEEFSGWLAKCILNFYGIDTSTGNFNKGCYKGQSVHETAIALLQSSSLTEQKIGRLLLDYRQD